MLYQKFLDSKALNVLYKAIVCFQAWWAGGIFGMFLTVAFLVCSKRKFFSWFYWSDAGVEFITTVWKIWYIIDWVLIFLNWKLISSACLCLWFCVFNIFFEWWYYLVQLFDASCLITQLSYFFIIQDASNSGNHWSMCFQKPEELNMRANWRFWYTKQPSFDFFGWKIISFK